MSAPALAVFRALRLGARSVHALARGRILLGVVDARAVVLGVVEAIVILVFRADPDGGEGVQDVPALFVGQRDGLTRLDDVDSSLARRRAVAGEGGAGVHMLAQRAVHDVPQLGGADGLHTNPAVRVRPAHRGEERHMVRDAAVDVDAAVVGVVAARLTARVDAELVVAAVVRADAAVVGAVRVELVHVMGLTGDGWVAHVPKHPDRRELSNGPVAVDEGGEGVGHALVECARLIEVDEVGGVRDDAVGQLVRRDVEGDHTGVVDHRAVRRIPECVGLRGVPVHEGHQLHPHPVEAVSAVDVHVVVVDGAVVAVHAPGVRGALHAGDGSRLGVLQLSHRDEARPVARVEELGRDVGEGVHLLVERAVRERGDPQDFGPARMDESAHDERAGASHLEHPCQVAGRGLVPEDADVERDHGSLTEGCCGRRADRSANRRESLGFADGHFAERGAGVCDDAGCGVAHAAVLDVNEHLGAEDGVPVLGASVDDGLTRAIAVFSCLTVRKVPGLVDAQDLAELLEEGPRAFFCRRSGDRDRGRHGAHTSVRLTADARRSVGDRPQTIEGFVSGPGVRGTAHHDEQDHEPTK